MHNVGTLVTPRRYQLPVVLSRRSGHARPAAAPGGGKRDCKARSLYIQAGALSGLGLQEVHSAPVPHETFSAVARSSCASEPRPSDCNKAAGSSPRPPLYPLTTSSWVRRAPASTVDFALTVGPGSWNRWQCARVAILRSAKSSLRQLQV